jgi:hypothetical protein
MGNYRKIFFGLRTLLTGMVGALRVSDEFVGIEVDRSKIAGAVPKRLIVKVQ